MLTECLKLQMKVIRVTLSRNCCSGTLQSWQMCPRC